MQIGIVTQNFYPQYGGIAENVYHTYQELRKLGHKVKIITSKPGPGPDRHVSQSDLFLLGRRMPIFLNGSFGYFAVEKFSLLRSVIEGNDFDVLHIHEPFSPILPLFALRYSKCANVATFHSSFQKNSAYKTFSGYLRKYFRKLHVKIAVSETARRSIYKYFPGEYIIVPNGVDLSKFGGKNGRKDNQVLFVGRMEPRKGLKYLLKAFPQVRQQFPNVKLVIVGSGPLSLYYRKILTRGLEGVVFLGRVSANQLPAIYADSTVLCAPSVSGESFGIVLLEGMAASLPIVASDIEGYRNVLANGKHGLLVRPKDPEKLAEALIRILSDAELRTRLGKAGRENAAKYDWPRIAKTIERCYYLALERRDRQGTKT